MSIKTWKQEFYPISALQAAKTLDVVGMVEHALTKWLGLRPKNMDKHDLRYLGLVSIIDDRGTQLNIDASTCSLCKKFAFGMGVGKQCVGCPLYESRGKVPCYVYAENETTYDSPYGHWMWDKDPEPMIKALRKALRWAKKHA